MNHYDVTVIGGGAAGMLAAAEAARRGLKVALLEKNDRLGIKLRITGKGRCNLTNNCSPREVIENTPTGGKFLYSALDAFPPQRVMEYFTNLGVPLKTERGNRVFPESDRARDVAEALIRQLEHTGVDIYYKTSASELLLDEEGRLRASGQAGGILPAVGPSSAPGDCPTPRRAPRGTAFRWPRR